MKELSCSHVEILSNIMPIHAIKGLINGKNAGELAKEHKDVTILFMDIVGFTEMSKFVEPQKVMLFLNTLFSIIDNLSISYGYVQKVETAGDGYVASAGVVLRNEDGFLYVVNNKYPAFFAYAMITFAKELVYKLKTIRMPHNNSEVKMRFGLHSGNIVTSVIGSTKPTYSYFGETMNIASRMETLGVSNKLHMTQKTYDLVKNSEYPLNLEHCQSDNVTIKGIGVMKTYIYDPLNDNQSSDSFTNSDSLYRCLSTSLPITQKTFI